MPIAFWKSSPAIFPPKCLKPDARTAAVVMTHRFDDDLAIARALLRDGYSVCGRAGTGGFATNALRCELAETLGPHDLKKLFAPVGLDLGAAEPAEIALAICGEVLAFMNGRAAGHLGSRTESIHAPIQNEERVLNISRVAETAACTWNSIATIILAAGESAPDGAGRSQLLRFERKRRCLNGR